MGFVSEFREFALKGNVVDLAVGVIIGGAFGGIVNSMIKDIIMPVVGMAGNVDFSNKYVALNEATRAKVTDGMGLEDARKLGPVLAYGNFLTITINFIILALCIFIMIKLMNNARKKFEKQKAVAPATPPAPPASEIYLKEIRDLLAARR